MSVRFENVEKSFGENRVLDHISFEVKPGEILFILGRSGMGKSVTLKHIIGLLKPDAGSVWVDEEEVSQLGSKELARIRSKCGMVFQHPALLDSLTIFENIAFGLRSRWYTELHGRALSEDEIKKKVHEKMDQVHLPVSVSDRTPHELSYGMQKRASLARTLAPEPSYLLFDEPTTGLDPITTNRINNLIQELSKKLQVTSLVVSHDMNCALKIADRILVLDQGKILAIGGVPEIVQSKEPLIQAFLEETLSLLTEEERKRIFGGARV